MFKQLTQFYNGQLTHWSIFTSKNVSLGHIHVFKYKYENDSVFTVFAPVKCDTAFGIWMPVTPFTVAKFHR